jgi:hypothetical protein
VTKVIIEIGRGGHSERTLDEATDEWVWMRIHELRYARLSPTFRVTLQNVSLNLELTTPEREENVQEIASGDSLEWEICEIWQKMGMNEVDYTAGAAVRFMHRLRLLFGNDSSAEGLTDLLPKKPFRTAG